jgi:glycosyltransferase involved in cell wall biosynthesis
MNNNLVSILIPNYNKSSYLKATLDSIVAQTFLNWECIIVDDYSTDDSWEILEEYAIKDNRFKIYKRPEYLTKGGNVCRNYAFEKSEGEFIQWFDSDDLMFETMIESRVLQLKSSTCDFIVHGGLYWDLESDFCSEIEVSNSIDDFKTFFTFDSLWLSQNVILTREFLLNKNILWNEKTPFFQDVFFNLDIIYSGQYKAFNTIDWIWRKTNGSLGSKTKKINSYDENTNFSLEYFRHCARFFKNYHEVFNWFCANRFLLLVKEVKQKQDSQSLLAFINVMNEKKT